MVKTMGQSNYLSLRDYYWKMPNNNFLFFLLLFNIINYSDICGVAGQN